MSIVAATDPLSCSVLVLNRFFMAVHVVNVRRAICLLFRDLAEVIHLEEGQYANYDFQSWCEASQLRSELEDTLPSDDWIRSVSLDLQAPRVIRLFKYDKVPKRGLRFNRRNLFARDRNQCQYCGKHFSTSDLSIDHVVPRMQNGQTTWENIVCCCVRCNVQKGGRTPKQARMKLIREPVRPKQSPLLSMKLGNPKYQSWKTFLSNAYWSVDLEK